MEKTKYLVDVFRIYAHCVEIEAETEDDAEQIAYEKARNNEFDMRDFTLTDDIETQCSGIADENGEQHYF